MNCDITKGTDYEWSEQGHGSEKVTGGRLKGQTDTDYFNFLCPRCADGQVMRIIDGVQHVGDTHKKYFLDGNKVLKNHQAKQRKCMVHLSFKIYCYKCKFTDIVKISNLQIAVNRNINNDSFEFFCRAASLELDKNMDEDFSFFFVIDKFEKKFLELKEYFQENYLLIYRNLGPLISRTYKDFQINNFQFMNKSNKAL